MNSTPLISICILNRNGLERLKKTLPSVLNQSYPNKEILVIDNGSTDKSLEYLFSLPAGRQGFEQIRIIKNGENLGIGRARNRGVASASGQFILMLDNDIELCQPNFLETILMDYLKLDHPAFLSPVVVDHKAEYVSHLGLYFNRLQLKKVRADSFPGKGCYEIPGFQGGAFFFRKDLFIRLGGFDEIYLFNLDDYDMSARAYLFGYKNYLTSNLLAIHHGIDTRDNPQSVGWKQKTYLCGFSRMIWKNYSLQNAIIWWPISSVWIFYKALKSSIKFKSVKPIVSYGESFFRFAGDLPSTLKLRKKIQSQRITKKDAFLKIEKIL